MNIMPTETLQTFHFSISYRK